MKTVEPTTARYPTPPPHRRRPPGAAAFACRLLIGLVVVGCLGCAPYRERVVASAPVPAVHGEPPPPGAAMVTTSSATTPSVVPASLATVGGYTLRPAPDITRPAGEGDRAPPAFYEVVPPTGQAVPTLGRVWASCSCLKAEAFDEIPGRALVRVRKVAAAPSAGDGFLLMVWLRVPENVVLQHTLPK